MSMPLMRPAFTPTMPLTPPPPPYVSAAMAHTLARSFTPPPPPTMSTSYAGAPMSSDFTLRPHGPDWQFYKPEDGTWQSFEATGNWLLETNYQATQGLGGGALPHPTIAGGNGVIYGIDYTNMIQYRQDDPDRIRKIRRVG